MTLPTKIHIQREENYHTDQIGICSDGTQYMGFTFFLEPYQTRLISVLHRFDRTGRHTSSKFWEIDPEESLRTAIAELPGATLMGTNVQPFTVEYDSIVFGLVPREDGMCYVYVPYGLVFAPPWDGTYDT